jgi:hypothetical protein
MGGADKVARQKKQGKLTVRERITALADGGSFREVGSIAGKAKYNEERELETFSPTNLFGASHHDLGLGSTDETRLAQVHSSASCCASHSGKNAVKSQILHLVYLLH